MMNNAVRIVIKQTKNTRPLRGRGNGERGHNAASSSGDPLARMIKT